MIIDSHAHYTHNSYLNTFRYLSRNAQGYTVAEGDLAKVLSDMAEAGIPCSIEPGIHMDGCQKILDLAAQYPGRIFPVMGIHPTRCIHHAWSQRRQLAELARTPGVVAIGECGLDYHHPRKEQQRFKQHMWFLYQLDLAWKLKKPLVLHIRNADRDALRILRHHPARKLGGVIHCFNGTKEIAQQYLDLGFHIGIGGSILQPEERAGELWEAVKFIPLDRLLLETDAPFILPYCKDVIRPKVLRRTRNTSLILPAVAEKIAELKNLPVTQIKQATANNAISLFGLPLEAN